MNEEFDSFFSPNDQSNDLIVRYENMVAAGEQFFFDVEEFEELIVYYMEERSSQQAFEVLHMAKSQHPSTNDLILREAELLATTGRFDDALRTLEKVEEIEKWNIDLYLTKASILSQVGRNQQAVEVLQHVIEIAPADEIDEICINLAFEYQNLNQPEKAVEALTKALKHNPENEEALYELAYCFEQTGDELSAIESFQAFIDNAPYSHHAWYCLGNVYMQIGALEKALEAYDYAIVIQDDFASGHFNKALCLIQLELYEQAIEQFHESLKYELIDSVCLFYIAECHFKLGEYRKAEIHYKKAIQKDERLTDAWIGMAAVLQEEGRLVEALHHVKRALSLDEKNAENWFLFAEMQVAMEFMEDAIQAYEKAIELGYTKLAIWLNYSDLLFHEGRMDECQSVMERAFESSPKESELYYRYTAYLLVQNMEAEALGFLDLGLKLNKERVNQLFHYYPDAFQFNAVIDLIEDANQ